MSFRGICTMCASCREKASRLWYHRNRKRREHRLHTAIDLFHTRDNTADKRYSGDTYILTGESNLPRNLPVRCDFSNILKRHGFASRSRRADFLATFSSARYVSPKRDHVPRWTIFTNLFHQAGSLWSASSPPGISRSLYIYPAAILHLARQCSSTI